MRKNIVNTNAHAAPHEFSGDASARIVVQVGDWGAIESAAFSSDGVLVVTGSRNGVARLWEVETGRELQRFEGHKDVVKTVAISADCKHILTAGGFDKTARLWELATGREIQRLEAVQGDSGYVHAVAFSPNGRHAMTGGSDNTARLWELAIGQELRRFEGHTGDVMSVAFSPDGCSALTGSIDGTARLWDIATGRELRRFEGHKRDAVQAVAFANDGRSILTGSSDKTARVWDVSSGHELHRLEGHTDSVWSVALSSDGRSALTGSRDGTARLWNLTAGQGTQHQEMQRLVTDFACVNSVAVSQDGRYVIITGEATNGDSKPRLWEADTGRVVRWFGGNADDLWAAAFSPDGEYMLIGGRYYSPGLWKVASGQQSRCLEGHRAPITSISFSLDSYYVLTGSEDSEGSDNTIRLWELATGREVRRYEHAGTVVAFSPDGGHIRAVSGKYIYLWETATGRELWKMFMKGADSVRFSPDDRHVIGLSSIGGAGNILWEVEAGRELPLDPLVLAVAFSENGCYALTGSRDKGAQLWEASTWHPVRRFDHAAEVNAVAFSPDGFRAVTGGWDRTVRLWETATGHELGRFQYPGYIALSITFSPKGRYVLVNVDNRNVHLWDTTTRQVLHFEDAQRIRSVTFSPDERFILTTSTDRTARLRNTETGEELFRLVIFRDGTWVVVKPDGRFDTNNLEEIKGVHWIMPDDPLHALPLEIFMRDYYEPRLLPRALAEQPGTFKPLRPLGELNRVQPKVKIVGVRRGESAEFALVDVEVTEEEDRSQTDGKTKTAVYDLRLYRGGQLVGEWPEAWSETGGQETIEAWRKRSKVPMVAGSTEAVHTFRVRLASRDKGQSVRFSAYAFNEDRVKSETAVDESYTVPADITPRTPRAYVLTIGVNAYENPRRTLSFAVADAQVLAGSLAQIRGYEVVAVSLISDRGLNPPVNQATKANIRTMLQLLAGKPADRSVLRGVANAEKLEGATPDDVVIMAFSGHGHTERDGRFYLVPADSGREHSVTEAVLSKFVSSEELSAWLRGVDAGEMALVIDACHSAASVEAPGFKPGPMGDRGLGQLAYDKGMQILAATKADDVALESERLGQGLLSYALVCDGLGQTDGEARRADLDGDGQVTLQEWLQYGEKRVPDLYVEIKEGKHRLAGRDIAADPGFFTQVARNAQTPSLFDFHRRTDSVVLVGG